MQTRRQSLIEAVVNIMAGVAVAYVMNHFLLASFGMPISTRNNLVMTAAMTAASLIRSYSLRRVFNRWHK